MNTFNVIIHDFNRNEFVSYDVMPYLREQYKERIRRHKKYGKEYPNDKLNQVPSTFEEFREFVSDESKYQFWARCQYEIILSDWPSQKCHKKIDVWDQIESNLDLVTKLLIEDVRRK